MEKLSYGWVPKLMKRTDREVEDGHGELTIFSPEQQTSMAWIEEVDGTPCLFIAGQGNDQSFSHIPLKVIKELEKLDALPGSAPF